MRTMTRRNVIYGVVLLVSLVVGACYLILNFQNGHEPDAIMSGAVRTSAISTGISESPMSPNGVAGISVEGSLAKSKDSMQQMISTGGKDSMAKANLTGGNSRYQGGAYGKALPGTTEKVIRKANLQIRIKKNKFEEVYEKTADIVAGKQGYVSSSRTNAVSGKIAGGELVIRIPADHFEDTMKSLKGLGKVQGLEVSSEEVSEEYVDLKSRLRNWRAQEAVMLDLMRRAKTISDSVTIQNNLQEIQMEIEQINGRLQYLDDRIGYSEIDLSLNEPQVAPVKNPPAIKTALKDAIGASLAVMSAIIVLAGYLLPLLILGALFYIAYKQIKKRMIARAITGKTA